MFVRILRRNWNHEVHVPAADIKHVRRDEDEWSIEMRGGETYHIDDIEARALLKERLPIIPASGLINACVLLMSVSDHTVHERMTRVIGWRIVADDDALPVLADTSTDDVERMTLVETPDGRWHSTDNMEFFDTLDEAKEAFTVDWDEKQKMREIRERTIKAMADEA